MATYNYECKNEECLTKTFTFRRSMEEHDQPTNCPQCGNECYRVAGDWCQNFRLKGSGWYAQGYSGASNGVPSWHSEAAKAGKNPYSEKG